MARVWQSSKQINQRAALVWAAGLPDRGNNTLCCAGGGAEWKRAGNGLETLLERCVLGHRGTGHELRRHLRAGWPGAMLLERVTPPGPGTVH